MYMYEAIALASIHNATQHSPISENSEQSRHIFLWKLRHVFFLDQQLHHVFYSRYDARLIKNIVNFPIRKTSKMP